MLLLENEVSIADMIVALDEQEIKELSNLYDPCGNEIDGSKIQYALDRAHCTVNASFVVAGDCGKAFMKLNSKNLIIDIARHYLDTVKDRVQVRENFEKACEQLKEYSVFDKENACPLTCAQLEEILGSPAPKTDNGFRFSGDCRKWTKKKLRPMQRRLFDHESVGGITRSGCCPEKECCD